MSVIEYVGMRYIPKVAEPITWNSLNEYEYFTIVQYLGDTYLSTKNVPANTNITNTEYWIRTATFNGQLESLRNRIEQNSANINSLETLLNITQTQLVAETTHQNVGTFTSNGFIGEVYIFIAANDQSSALWAGATGVETFNIICPESIKSKAFNSVNKYCFLRHEPNDTYIAITKNTDIQFTDAVIFNIVAFTN